MIMAEDIIVMGLDHGCRFGSVGESKGVLPTTMHSLLSVGLRWLRLAFSTHPQTALGKRTGRV